ncbi:hypothetical protein MSAN_00345100 [Mycena sanguinolenta]|uniref:Zn(2)-C6 fungal-type domain-containing protein n=1 Tax=Mycena sanguinolenta TaxID=230812 RepID=A0A8H7DHK3_9AGAR|nr:hypothetical protein MSAN_00345100 [Mycena sanguinolenta]
MRQYATKHAERWYKHVNEARGRGLVNGSLYLVTGCEKAKSWGMASFCGVSLPGQNEFQLSFRPTDSETGRYRWKAPNCRHKHADLSPVDGTLLNQTTFIHAFAISLSDTIWGSLFGKVEISQLVGDSTFVVGKSGGGFIPYGRQGSLFRWSLFGGSHGTTGGGKQCSAPTHQNVILSSASPIPRVFHPSQIIHERIRREVPQARVMITHDDDWCDIITKGSMRIGGQNLWELQQAIFDCSEIIEENGAAFLRTKSETTALENEAIAFSDMDIVPTRQERQFVLQQHDGYAPQHHQPQLQQMQHQPQTESEYEHPSHTHEHAYRPTDLPQGEFALATFDGANAATHSCENANANAVSRVVISPDAASSPVTQDPADVDLWEDDDTDTPSPSKRARTDSPHFRTLRSSTVSASILAPAKSSPSGKTKEAGTKGGGAKKKEQKGSGGKRRDQKPSLSCLYCRGRKIVCGPRYHGGCGQCQRRGLECEYSIERGRGMRKKARLPFKGDYGVRPMYRGGIAVSGNEEEDGESVDDEASAEPISAMHAQ